MITESASLNGMECTRPHSSFLEEVYVVAVELSAERTCVPACAYFSYSFHSISKAGVGNFVDGKGHYIFTFTLEGHYAYTVKYI